MVAQGLLENVDNAKIDGIVRLGKKVLAAIDSKDVQICAGTVS